MERAYRTHRPDFLREALVLAGENIIARLDRERNYRPFFRIALDPPARGVHDSWDFCDMAGRYVEALVLIRRHAGISWPEAEAGLRRFLLVNANPADGLFYNQEAENSSRLADMFCQSRVILGLCAWYEESREERALAPLKSLVHGLMRIAERKGNYLHYPRNHYRDGEWLDGGLFYAPKDLITVKPGYGGTQIEGMMTYFSLTGDEAVLPFARDYLEYFLRVARVVKEDGSFEGHLHSQGIVPTMIGAEMLAEATGDRDLLALCERFLRFILDHCSRFGWTPDGIGWPTCETCALGDAIHLAVRLSLRGQGDFWHDIERFARNQLVENQFRDAERVLAGRDPLPGTDRLVRGSFASWAKPNDLLGGPDIEGCCAGAGAKAISHVLSNAVGREPDGTVAVRMLFDAETDDAAVRCRMPEAGEVRVIAKRDLALKIRRPEGLTDGDLRLKVDGRAVPTVTDGSYLLLGPLAAGTEAEMRFPLRETVREEIVAGEAYAATWRGSAVIRLTPEGVGYPIYR